MNPDRAIHLAAAAVEIAQREMGLDRFAVDLQQLDEYFDRLVGLLVEKVVDPLEIAGSELLAGIPVAITKAAPSDVPPRGGRQRKEQPQQIHTGHVRELPALMTPYAG